MQKKLTITIDEEVYEGLHRIIGRGRISGSIMFPSSPRCEDLYTQQNGTDRIR